VKVDIPASANKPLALTLHTQAKGDVTCLTTSAFQVEAEPFQDADMLLSAPLVFPFSFLLTFKAVCNSKRCLFFLQLTSSLTQ
jgi:hypothetical protein